MKSVIMTSGPRGAGKSTYCKRVLAENPDIQWISLDETMTRVFGYPWPDTDTGAWSVGYRIMMEDIALILKTNPSAIILADMWNGTCVDREALIRKLLLAGADKVAIWYFTTPVDTSRKWFVGREYVSEIQEIAPDIRQWRARSYDLDHRRYHINAHDLQAGIITVRHPDWYVAWAPQVDIPIARINPAQLLLPEMPLPLPFV